MIAPERLKLTMMVMSIAFAREAGGGFQQVPRCSNTSLMVLTCLSSARVGLEAAIRNSAAAIILLAMRHSYSSLDVGGDLHLDHLVGIGRRLALVDLVDDIHAGHDVADHGVFAVEEGGFRKADEELRIGGIVALGARHADGAALERF